MSTPEQSNDEAWRARAEGPKLWAAQNLELLELIWTKFDTSGDWPNAKVLQRELFGAGKNFHAAQFARSIPPQLGRLDMASEKLLLTRRGLSFVADARSLLDNIPRLIAIAVDRYADPGAEPRVGSAEFEGLLGIDSRRAEQLTRILLLDSWLFRAAGNGPGGDQQFEVDETAILDVRNVRSVDEYFEAQERAWYGVPRGSEIPSPIWEDAGTSSEGVYDDDIDQSVPSSPLAEEAEPVTMSVGTRSVFVVHGRNEDLRKAMFEFLRSIDLAPMEWSHAVELTAHASPYIGEILDAAFRNAQAVVVLMTPDEVAYLQPKYGHGEDDPETLPAAQARPNVLFEAGMALGRDPARTVLVEVGEVRPFSDVAGRHAVRLSNSVGSRQALANRLRTAGCPVNVAGTDWHSGGRLHGSRPTRRRLTTRATRAGNHLIPASVGLHPGLLQPKWE